MSNPVHQYNDKESKALNIYKAAGSTGIADIKMPKKRIQKKKRLL